MRQIGIGLVAAAIVTAASTLTASAIDGRFGGGGFGRPAFGGAASWEPVPLLPAASWEPVPSRPAASWEPAPSSPAPSRRCRWRSIASRMLLTTCVKAQLESLTQERKPTTHHSSLIVFRDVERSASATQAPARALPMLQGGAGGLNTPCKSPRAQ